MTDDSDFGNFGRSMPTAAAAAMPVAMASAKKDASSSSEDETSVDFEEEALKAHNACRSKHGVGPLKLDKKVSLCGFFPRSS